MSIFFSGQGILYTAIRLSTGKPGVIKDAGNASLFKLGLKTDTSIKKESRSGFRLPVARLGKGNEAEISLTLDEYTLDNLALALYGQVVTKAAGTVTAEPLPTGLLAGNRVQLANPKVSDVVLTDSATTPATVTPTTNYTVDADPGHILIVDPGAFVQPFKAAYGYAASKKMGAFVIAPPERMIILEGVNTADSNRRVRITVFRVLLDPASDIDFLNDDFASLPMKGSALVDETRSSADPLGQFCSYEYLDA